MKGGGSASGTSSASGQVDGEIRAKGAKPGRARGARGKRRPLDEDEARRALAASRKLYYRIGEVSELTGVKAHVLRYWETEFRWMAPPKSRSKQRLYRKRDIEFVWLLKQLLWDQRYTIAGARQRIQELGLDEALARCADDESLDAALLSVGVAGASPTTTGAEKIGSGIEVLADSADGGVGPLASPDWTGLQVALESLQSELLELRGVLQQGL